MNISNPARRLPIVPRFLVRPLKLVPTRAHSTAFVTAANRVFAQHLQDGDLDFLEDRTIEIRVSDLEVVFRLTLKAGRLAAQANYKRADLTVEGTAYDYLLLMTRREDSDTLFFNRRLKLGGDTELGLFLKNFLDALEPEEHWKPFLVVLDRFTGLVGRFG